MNLKKESLFYFDCEWVPLTETLEELQIVNSRLYDAFLHKAEKINDLARQDGKEYVEPKILYKNKSHMYPELCQIICVSYGYFNLGVFEIKSIYGSDEYKLLNSVATLFNMVDVKGFTLAGAAILRYDMPWLSKRMMINNIIPPKNLNMYGKKPWEITVFDLPEVWGQGCKSESYTTLELICAALDIEGSKDDLTGFTVFQAFLNGELERIKNYCEKDVLVTSKCINKLIQLSY